MRYALNHCRAESVADGQAVRFTGPCVVTGELYSVTVTNEELMRYQNGALIQNAMPSVSREDREFLMSGYSPRGWEMVWNEDFLEDA